MLRWKGRGMSPSDRTVVFQVDVLTIYFEIKTMNS